MMINKKKKNNDYYYYQNVIRKKKKKKILIDSLNQGQKFHSCLKSYLESDEKENYSICDKDVEKCWMSLNHVLPDIDNVKLIEKPVYHPVLMYRGVLDCVASYR